MSYPKFYSSVKAMGPQALLSKRWATAVARKAGIKRGASGDFGPDVGGTFSEVNDNGGFVFALSGGEQAFPMVGSMTRLADETAETEERLLVNVSSAGPSDSYLQARGLTVPLDATGINVSAWTAIGTGEIDYTVYSPDAGSVTLGLVQRQTR